MTIKVETVKLADAVRVIALVSKLDFSKNISYFQKCLENKDDVRMVLVGQNDAGHDCGIVVINFASTYPLFRRLNIPEIQDLNVISDARGQGVAAALVQAAEDIARERGHTQMGIGVGLTASYGPAQRLYAKLGYLPDGAGISYDGSPVRAGDMRAMDDQLCLFMVKDL